MQRRLLGLEEGTLQENGAGVAHEEPRRQVHPGVCRHPGLVHARGQAAATASAAVGGQGAAGGTEEGSGKSAAQDKGKHGFCVGFWWCGVAVCVCWGVGSSERVFGATREGKGGRGVGLALGMRGARTHGLTQTKSCQTEQPSLPFANPLSHTRRAAPFPKSAEQRGLWLEKEGPERIQGVCAAECPPPLLLWTKPLIPPTHDNPKTQAKQRLGLPGSVFCVVGFFLWVLQAHRRQESNSPPHQRRFYINTTLRWPAVTLSDAAQAA